MKLSMTMTMTRKEHVALVQVMDEMHINLCKHITTISEEEKLYIRKSMIKDLNVLPGLSFKSKSKLGGVLYTVGLTDEIELEATIVMNELCIKRLGDLTSTGADIVGPFLNAALAVRKGDAIKLVKAIYSTIVRESKPTELTRSEKRIVLDDGASEKELKDAQERLEESLNIS